MLRTTILITFILYTISIISYYNKSEARSFYKTYYSAHQRTQHTVNKKKNVPYLKTNQPSPNQNKHYARDKINVPMKP